MRMKIKKVINQSKKIVKIKIMKIKITNQILVLIHNQFLNLVQMMQSFMQKMLCKKDLTMLKTILNIYRMRKSL